MTLSKYHLWTKLTFVALVSSLWLLLGAGFGRAHEVTPTIADLRVSEGRLTLDLRLNVESFLAGIDLDGLENTEETDQSDLYDQYRAQSPDELTPQMMEFARGWVSRIALDAGAAVPLQVERVEIPPVGDADLPRASHLFLSAELPDGTRNITLGWPGGAGDLVLRQQGVDEPFTGYIKGGQTSAPISIAGGDSKTAWGALVEYIPVGFDHILPKGLDHILFVLGLFFLVPLWGALLWQVSAFTLAHTVTLALGATGWVSVPGSIVEPLIAASITFVAIENIVIGRLYPGRLAVVFGFGLLHGLGFASVLGDYGLPEGQFIPSLIGFNIGVELGQIAVLAMAFAAVGLWFRNKPWYRARIAIPASAVIALIGAWWVIERTLL